MTQPSQFELRSQDTCSHPWPCTCTPRQHHGADMTQTTPLTKYAVDDLLGLQIQTTVYGHIIRLQAKEYPGIPGPTTAEIKLNTGGSITLPLTQLTVREGQT